MPPRPGSSSATCWEPRSGRVGGALVAIGARADLDPWVGLLGAFAVAAAVGLIGLAVAGAAREPPGGDRLTGDEGDAAVYAALA